MIDDQTNGWGDAKFICESIRHLLFVSIEMLIKYEQMTVGIIIIDV